MLTLPIFGNENSHIKQRPSRVRAFYLVRAQEREGNRRSKRDREGQVREFRRSSEQRRRQ